jgi:hypothetical protein
MSGLKEQKQGSGSIKVSASRRILEMTREVRTFEHLNTECKSLFWISPTWGVWGITFNLSFGDEVDTSLKSFPPPKGGEK